MEHKIKYTDFLETFSEKGRKNIEDYNNVIRLHKKGYAKKEIKKLVKVSDDKLHRWRNTSTKPIVVKTLHEAKKRGYFKTIKGKNLEILAYLIGYNLGDGNVSRNLCNSWFYGVNTDLRAIRKLLLHLVHKAVIYTYKIDNGKMAVHDKVFSRFLVCCGAIIGDKTKSKVQIPSWILKTKKASKVKVKFLQGFLDSELSNIKKNKTRKLAYQSLSIYVGKHKNKINEGKFFLNQIKDLLKEFDVSASPIKLDREYFRKRDQSVMQQLYITIHSNYFNLYNLITKINFLHNAKRKRSALIALQKIKRSVGERVKNIQKYDQALLLRKKGLSAYKIAALLSLKPYHVKNWVYYGRKPLLYDYSKQNPFKV